ncbi:MAG: hypothetical protein BroJett029_22400 [Alphaproteobacteria bacterium]|nr:MAG: hypothetical protein BroJett029_22400 [Alphaproteobacteria bacterium]
MFSVPSLGKLLVLAAIIALVWFGFRLLSRLEKARKEQAQVARPSRKAAKPSVVEDTVKCPVCSAYVAARGAGSCGRADCPY